MLPSKCFSPPPTPNPVTMTLFMSSTTSQCDETGQQTDKVLGERTQLEKGQGTPLLQWGCVYSEDVNIMELPGTTEQGLTVLTLLVILSPTLATYPWLDVEGRTMPASGGPTRYVYTYCSVCICSVYYICFCSTVVRIDAQWLQVPWSPCTRPRQEILDSVKLKGTMQALEKAHIYNYWKYWKYCCCSYCSCISVAHYLKHTAVACIEVRLE